MRINRILGTSLPENTLEPCFCVFLRRIQYSNDTNITAAGECLHDIEDAVNSDLENLRQWLMVNKLSLNVAKTEFQIIGTKPMLKKASTKKLNLTFIIRTNR